MTAFEVRTYPRSRRCSAGLKRMGFSYDGDAGAWTKEKASPGEIPEMRAFARRNRVRCRVIERGYTRSAAYRQDFFKSHPDGPYRCAYCGKKISKKDLQVDHIVPVYAVENIFTRDRYIALLRRRGIDDINDAGNLAASCPRCNRRKGAKTGFWIVRGRLGRNGAYCAALRCFLAAAKTAAAALAGAALLYAAGALAP